MNIKAISRTLLIVIIVVIIAVAGIAGYFLSLMQQAPPKATLTVYVGHAGGSGDQSELYWIVTPANQTFKVGDRIKIVLNVNYTNYPTGLHGFAILDPNGNQIASLATNVGGTTDTVITLNVAGTYKINCLYFCGTWHALNGKMQNVVLLTATS
jgi:heme/copper-type cytochrome/quinol oxidase subunit 2